MKRIALVIVALALVAAPAMYASWTGWITDEHCAGKGAKAEHKGCALRCAERGAKLVLFNSADQKVYALDKQDLAKEHIGHEVTVSGEADGDSIKVSGIEKSKPAAQ